MSKTLKAVIVDDERLARAELRSLLEEHPSVEIQAEFGNPKEAVTYLNENAIDLLFLDIQMPEMDGFQVLEALDKAPEVIFTTAYDEFAIKAFEVNAIDYLLKPIDEDRLSQTLENILGSISESPVQKEEEGSKTLTIHDQVFVKDGDKCWFVKLADVRLFESEGNYIRVYFENNKPLILKSLNNLEKKLSDKYFFRANRKHVINLEWIESIETWFNGGLLVELKDGKKIEISRRQSAKLKERMSL